METVIETPAYLAAAADAGMTEAEMEAAVLMVSANPLAGDLMVGTGGCRKLRLAGKGKGKSGGYRLITFYKTTQGVLLLTVFSKGDRANLNKAERNALKSPDGEALAGLPSQFMTKEGQMSKRAFEKIKAGLEDAIAISEGRADPSTYRVHVPAEIDVKAIRARTGLSQDKFANRFGFKAATLRDWEQGRSRPEPTARVLLTVIDREPEAVERALAAGA